jgi:endo-1,4-beta-xylanase
MNDLFKRRLKKLVILGVVLCFASLVTATAQTICSNETGTHEGLVYELWFEANGGRACMTLHPGSAFSCEWTDVDNVVSRLGKRFDRTQTHQEIGTITVDYGCTNQPEGDVYMGAYGWTTDPLIEYYIVESWGNTRPPDAEPIGTITVDGDIYDIYETIWIANYIGDNNHYQNWSVRRSKRTTGTISVSQHFAMWESLGMDMGNLYDVSFVIEGFESGNAEVNFLSVDIFDPDPSPDPTPYPTITPQPSSPGDVNADGTIDIVDALLTAQYYVGLDPADFLPGNADTNCDGEINIVDALLIAQYYVGLIANFC